jgi:hypothetical protein
MRFIRGNLTKRKHKNAIFIFKKKAIFAMNFAKNEVLSLNRCKNYTISNFTIMKPIPGTFPEK